MKLKIERNTKKIGKNNLEVGMVINNPLSNRLFLIVQGFCLVDLQDFELLQPSHFLPETWDKCYSVESTLTIYK